MSVYSNRGHRHDRETGLTLLEMVLFIVVLGVAGVALIATLALPLTGAGEQTRALTAAQVVQARTELMLGQKRKSGYPEDPPNCATELDPCPGAGLSACSLPSGWSVSTGCEAWSSDPDTSEYIVLVVAATGPDGGSASARTLIANLGEE